MPNKIISVEEVLTTRQKIMPPLIEVEVLPGRNIIREPLVPYFASDGSSQIQMPNRGFIEIRPDGTNLLTDKEGKPILSFASIKTSTLHADTVITVGVEGDWRVELAGLSSIYPIRYWNGTTTKFSLDKNGNVIISGELVAATGTLGSLTIASGGHIKLGQTAYDIGIGFWLGDVAGTAKFSIGNAAGNKLTWDGSTLAITGSISGRLTSTIAGAIDASGNLVTDVVNARFKTSTREILDGFKLTSSGALNISGTQTALTASAAVGAASITVSSTTGFPTSGVLFLQGNANWMRITYTGVTATTFTGIPASGTGSITEAADSGKQVIGGPGVIITPKGIVTINSSGVETIILEGSSGNATFAGTLSAASGTLGSITAGTFTGITIAIGSLNSIFKADANGIYLGNATFASAPFRVNMAGDLTATSATIGGTLSAVTGTLGALTIASGGNIKLGQTAYNTGIGFWWGDVAGTPKFSIGDGSTKYITWDGSALNIRGSLNADDIVAGTLTGRRIRTAASGQRVEMDETYNAIYFYDLDNISRGYFVGQPGGIYCGGTAFHMETALWMEAEFICDTTRDLIPTITASYSLGSLNFVWNSLNARFVNFRAGGQATWAQILLNDILFMDIFDQTTYGQIVFQRGAAGCDLLPYADNYGQIGYDTRRWSRVRAVAVVSGDYIFENKFRLTEEDKKGIAFFNQLNEKVAILDSKGNFYVKGKIYENNNL